MHDTDAGPVTARNSSDDLGEVKRRDLRKGLDQIGTWNDMKVLDNESGHDRGAGDTFQRAVETNSESEG
jgi:hypothetical protein